MKKNCLNPQLTRGLTAEVIEPIMRLSSNQNIQSNPIRESNVGAFQGKCKKCGILGHKKSSCPEHQEDYETSVGRDTTSTKSPSKEGIGEEGTSSGKRKYETIN